MNSLFDKPLLESPLLRSRLGCVAVALLLVYGISLRTRNLEIPTGRSPDETNYTAQAARLLREGSAGLRGIAADYVRDPAARLAGPPTRAGYLWLLAATMRITGRTDESAGAMLSCAASIGSLLLVALIGIRFFPPWATVFALLFFGIFPAELELARRAWTDALVGLLGLAVVYTAMEITRDSTRRFWHMAFILTGCLSIVVKEFGAVIFALCAAWVVWVVLIQRRQRRDGLIIIAAGLAGSLASLLWLAHAVGGFSTLWQIVLDWRGAHVANQYAIEFQSGPPSHLFRTLYVMSPAAAICFIVGLLVVAVSAWKEMKNSLGDTLRNSRAPIIGLTGFGLTFVAIPLVLPNWLNLRYISVLFGPFFLLAGLGFSTIVTFALGGVPVSKLRTAAAILLITATLAVASSDVRRFPKFFVNDGVGDLSVKLILDRADMFEAERVVKRSPTPEHYLDLCWRYEQNWRYKDSIAACANALKLRPSYAEAYDQMAVAHVGLEQWEEAASAARQALQLNAALPRAKANLERASREAAEQSTQP